MEAESSFLKLPVEIRLQIYEYCCTINGPITLSSWRVPAWWPHTIHPKSERIPGVHRDHMPIATRGYDRAVLEGHPALGYCECIVARSSNNNIVSMFPDYYDPYSSDPSTQYGPVNTPTKGKTSTTARKPSVYMLPAGPSPSNQSPPFLHPTESSLHLTCGQIHQELRLYRNLHSERGAKLNRCLDLYLSYPDGVCLAVHRYPHLLHQARAIHIAGISDLIGVENPSKNPTFDHQKRPQQDHVVKSRIPSLEEEQAHALHLLVLNIHHLGTRALAATDRESDMQQSLLSNPSSLLHQPSSSPISSSSTIKTTTPSSSSSTDSFPESPSARQRHQNDQPSLHIRTIYPATLLNRRVTHNAPLTNVSSPYARFAIGYATVASHDPYRDVWGHKFSPVTTAFAAMSGGEITVSIARGSQGVGVDLVARGNGGVRRYVDSSFESRLHVGGEGESAMWRWLVPDEWGQEPKDKLDDDDDDLNDFDDDDDDVDTPVQHHPTAQLACHAGHDHTATTSASLAASSSSGTGVGRGMAALM